MYHGLKNLDRRKCLVHIIVKVFVYSVGPRRFYSKQASGCTKLFENNPVILGNSSYLLISLLLLNKLAIYLASLVQLCVCARHILRHITCRLCVIPVSVICKYDTRYT